MARNRRGREYFILDDEHQPVQVDLFTWGVWFARLENRTVAWGQVNSETHVSTVFLGLDHSFGGRGPRVMFETMVFGGPQDQYQQRYSTWDDAKAGHDAIVRKLRAKQRLTA
jgi:hypothetical protein